MRRINQSLLFCFVAVLVQIEMAIAKEPYVRFEAIGSGEVEGNLQVYFKMLTDDMEIKSTKITLLPDARDNQGVFPVDIFPPFETDEVIAFYIFAELIAAGGDNEVIGLLPVTFIDSPKDSRSNILGKIQVYRLESKLELDAVTCWNNRTERPNGRAARESFPFLNTTKVDAQNLPLVLCAVRDLIEHRFINTCPTWNRLRSMIKEEFENAWRALNGERLSGMLDYMASLNNLAATNDNYRELHKVYNDLLIKMLDEIPGNTLGGQITVADKVFSEQKEFIANNVNPIAWRLDDIIRVYEEKRLYTECLEIFSAMAYAIPASKYVMRHAQNTPAMQDRMYAIFNHSCNCSSRLASSEKVGVIVEKLKSVSFGSEYMEQYVSLFKTLSSIGYFPHDNSLSRRPLTNKEIKKYYDGFKATLASD